jgi:hypothetical protein
VATDGGAVALGIMGKAPIAGASKTRLCPPLDPAEAARLSACFIADVASAIDLAAGGGAAGTGRAPATTGDRGVVVFTPDDGGPAFDDLVPPGFARLAQRGRDLGERLLHATEDLLGDGFAGVCLINSDSPTLPPALLALTAAALRRPGDRLVLGPAIDGGYYLIGLKRPHARLFDGIAWSTNQVLAQTLARAAAARLPVMLLAPWYDVDDLGSLHLLLHDLFGGGSGLAGNGLTPGSAPRSRAFLQGLLWRDDGARLGFDDGIGR